jgi:hypothetical protein
MDGGLVSWGDYCAELVCAVTPVAECRIVGFVALGEWGCEDTGLSVWVCSCKGFHCWVGCGFVGRVLEAARCRIGWW